MSIRLRHLFFGAAILIAGATAFVIFGSIVIPLAILTAVCWFFWKHRHDV